VRRLEQHSGDWVKQKKINVLVRYVPDRPADMDAVVPYAVDLVSDAREKQIIEFLAAPAQLGNRSSPTRPFRPTAPSCCKMLSPKPWRIRSFWRRPQRPAPRHQPEDRGRGLKDH